MPILKQLDRLLAIHEQHPFDVVIPCLDGELPQFIAIRDQLEAAGVSVSQSPADIGATLAERVPALRG